MSREHILVVEDEEDILEVLVYHLAKAGFKVTCVTSGEEALEEIQAQMPHLLILDLMLPGMSGMDVCRKMKEDSKTQKIPVIMLTAKDEEADILKGFEEGAVDYVTKPFSSKVLIARIKSVLQHKQPTPLLDKSALVQIHDLLMDPQRYEVQYKQEPIKLTLSEFNILYFLSSSPGQVFSRYQIVNATRGEAYAVTDRTIDVQILAIRKKLGEAGNYIETIRGVGYRFKD
ncbi:response regulator transcription factor [Deltaproteobacteria bacterium TL4]